jgi:hypothetical protein
MTERMMAWQCVGCGRIEGAQPCVGVCQDRRMEFIYAADYDEVLAQLALLRERAGTLEAVVRQIACTTPRAGEAERTYRALQLRAQLALKSFVRGEKSARAPVLSGAAGTPWRS